MYRKPQAYVDKWLKFLDENPDGEADNFTLRVMRQQFEEIGPVLGENPYNIVESLWWSEARVEIAILARAEYDLLTSDNEGAPTE